MRYCMKKYALLILVILAVSVPVNVYADWPTDSEWIPMEDSGGEMVDPHGDTTGSDSVDLVGDATHPTAYTYYDGTDIYYRLRIDVSPEKSGYLKPFGWGILIDTDNNSDDYEFLVMADGVGDALYIAQNTSPDGLGLPNDKAETLVDPYPEDLCNGSEGTCTQNFRVVMADTFFPLTPVNKQTDDYFLDFRLSYQVFKDAVGVNDTTPIRYFFGTSNSAQTISVDLSAATLDAGFSEPRPVTGVEPTEGAVMFDIISTTMYSGDTINIRVEDADQNYMTGTVQSVSVTVTTPGGDSITLDLIETGANTGIFTGSIPSSSAAIDDTDQIAQVSPVEIITVTYSDKTYPGMTESSNPIARTDTLTVETSADLSLEKSIDNATPAKGSAITYTIKVKNNGPGSSSGVQVYDMLPTYINFSSADPEGPYNETTGIWEVPDLFSGYSTTLKITAIVDNSIPDNSTITNFANITTAVQVDPDSSNNSDSAVLSLSGADISVSKTVSDSTPSKGDAISYSVSVTNLSNNDATNLLIYDLLPAGVDHTGDDGGVSYDETTGLWNVGTLLNYSSKTLVIFANVTGSSGSTITNFANVSSVAQADPDSTNDSASVDIYVGGTDIEINKTVDNNSPNEGDTVLYTIKAYNNGPNDVTGLVIDETLPTYVSYSGSDPSQGSFNNVSGLWNVGAILNNYSATLEIYATVNSGTGGTTITNTAFIDSAGELDQDTGNDSNSASLTVQKAELAISKVVDNEVPDELDTIFYTITVTNSGPNSATGVEITDNLPAGLTFSNASSSTFGDYSSSSGIWYAGTIASGASAALTIFATVDTGTNLSTLINSATITSSDQADFNSSNDSDSVAISVGGTDIHVEKTTDNASPNIGTTFNYTVTVTNQGPLNGATGLVIADNLPSDLTYNDYSSTQGTFNEAQDKWTVGSLALNATASITFNVTVPGTTPLGTIITNTASVTDVDQGDYDSSDNSASVSLTVGSSDIEILKYSNYSTATATTGDVVTYTIQANNLGSFNNVSTIRIEDQIPSFMTYSSHSATLGTYSSSSGYWDIDTLAASGSATLTVFATIDSDACGQTITNTASLISTKIADPNSANNTGSASFLVKCADLQVSKSASDTTPDEGEEFIYTITVTNNGPYDTTGIELTDTLDAGLTFLNASTALGSYSGGIWTVGPLAKLDSAELYIKVKANSGTGGTNIPNIATVSANDLSDPTPGNNSGSIEVTPNAWPNLMLLKWSTIASSPSYYIPGALVNYFIKLSNQGGGEAERVVVTEGIPVNTEFYAGDLGGGAPIVYTETVATGLGTPVFTYSQDGSDYNYTPVPDGADGDIDNTVTNFKVTFDNASTMLGSAAPPFPEFQLRFRVRIK